MAPVPDGDDPHAATTWVLELLQAWLASEALADVRLAVLTDHALAVADGDAVNLAHAGVPGLVRSAASEHPLRFRWWTTVRATSRRRGRERGARGRPARRRRCSCRGSSGPARAAGPWCRRRRAVGGWACERAGSLEGLTLLPSDAGTAELDAGQVRVAVAGRGSELPRRADRAGDVPGAGAAGQRGRRRGRWRSVPASTAWRPAIACWGSCPTGSARTR